METLKAIQNRKSTRKFKPDQISESDLDTILKAGCAAPIGLGDHSVLHFTVVQNPSVLKQISDEIKSALNMNTNPIYDVPTLVIISSKKSEHLINIEYSDTACCAENMILAATDCGIASIYLWGPTIAVQSSTVLQNILSIPDGYQLLASVGLGYAMNATDNLRELKLKNTVTRL